MSPDPQVIPATVNHSLIRELIGPSQQIEPAVKDFNNTAFNTFIKRNNIKKNNFNLQVDYLYRDLEQINEIDNDEEITNQLKEAKRRIDEVMR